VTLQAWWLSEPGLPVKSRDVVREINRFEAVVNWLTDQDWVWWPLVRFRPEPTELFSTRLALGLSLAVAVVPAAAVFVSVLGISVATRVSGGIQTDPTSLILGAIGFALAVFVAWGSLVLLAAYCWNRRVARLAGGEELTSDAGANAPEQRFLVLATVVGWTIFRSFHWWYSSAGLLVLALGQWMAVRRRWQVSGYWVPFLMFSVSLGYLLGDLIGGNVQNQLDGISWLAGGIEYLGPDRSALGYVVAKTVSGASVGGLFALAQWMAVRAPAATAWRWVPVSIVALAVASAASAAVHVLVQRTMVGVYLAGFWGGFSAVFGWGPATADACAWGSLVVSAALLEGIIAGIVVRMSFAAYWRGVNAAAPLVSRNAVASFVVAASALAALVLSMLLAQWYPPATSGGSQVLGQAGSLIVFLGLGWMVLGPVALRQGVRALRSAAIRERRETGKALAWIGVMVSGAIVCLAVFGLVVAVFFPHVVGTLPTPTR
jgi:hypothetical protein